MKIDSSEPTNPVACEPGGEPPPPPPARTNAEKFWAALMPAQALDLLKAAPKVAGPWTPTQFGAHLKVREDHAGHVVAGEERTHAVFAVSPSTGPTCASPFFDTAEEADSALRELGWILVD